MPTTHPTPLLVPAHRFTPACDHEPPFFDIGGLVLNRAWTGERWLYLVPGECGERAEWCTEAEVCEAMGKVLEVDCV